MAEGETWFLQSLPALELALETARLGLLTDSAGALKTAGRVTAELARGASAGGHTSLAEMAAEAMTAPPATLVDRLDRLEAEVHRVLEANRAANASLLVICDHLPTQRSIRAALSSPTWEVHFTTGVVEAERELHAHEMALVILDLDLTSMDGRDLLVRLRRRTQDVAVPILTLSASAGPALRAECFALGADQVIGKPFDPVALTATVANRLRRTSETTRWARLDPLTGLLNRAGFRSAFERLRSSLDPGGLSTILGVLDLDHMKEVNDTYGHAKGDEVLRETARVIAGALRRTDVLARWGGEEFLVLFPDSSEAGAAVALENALKRLREVRFRSDTGTPRKEFGMTFSAGLAAVPATGGLDEAFLAADRCLYRAKEAGRNLVLTSQAAALPVRRALLVEDDPVMAGVVKGLLEADGLATTVVSDGARAAALGPGMHVAIAVLDVILPNLSGFEVLRALRGSPAFERVPVVILTGRSHTEDVARGFELGADDYVVKPFSPIEFHARVRRLLRRS